MEELAMMESTYISARVCLDTPVVIVKQTLMNAQVHPVTMVEHVLMESMAIHATAYQDTLDQVVK